MNKSLQRAIKRGYVGQGNVISDTQFSSFIRSHDQTECNGFTFSPGQLRAFDIGSFSSAHALRLLQGRTDHTVLYCWRNGRVQYGATLATPEGVIISRVILRGPGFRDSVATLEQAAGLVPA